MKIEIDCEDLEFLINWATDGIKWLAENCNPEDELLKLHKIKELYRKELKEIENERQRKT